MDHGDDYGIVDISMISWARNLVGMYDAGGLVDYAALRNVPAWLTPALARTAVQRGLSSPDRK